MVGPAWAVFGFCSGLLEYIDFNQIQRLCLAWIVPDLKVVKEYCSGVVKLMPNNSKH